MSLSIYKSFAQRGHHCNALVKVMFWKFMQGAVESRDNRGRLSVNFEAGCSAVCSEPSDRKLEIFVWIQLALLRDLWGSNLLHMSPSPINNKRTNNKGPLWKKNPLSSGHLKKWIEWIKLLIKTFFSGVFVETQAFNVKNYSEKLILQICFSKADSSLLFVWALESSQAAILSLLPKTQLIVR